MANLPTVNNLASKFDLANKLWRARRLMRRLYHEEHVLRRAKKKLMGVTEEKIAGIAKRYRDRKPEKQRRKMLPLLHTSCRNLEIFVKEYKLIFTELDRIVTELERLEKDDLTEIGEILRLWSESGLRRSVFLPEIVSDLTKAFNHFIDEVKSFTIKEARDDRRLSRGRQPRVGLWTRHKSENALVRQMRKLAKRAEKNWEREQEIALDLRRQVFLPEINFPYLFSELLEKEGMLEAVLVKLRGDVRQLIVNHIWDHNKVIHHINPIVAIWHRYDEYRRYYQSLETELNDFYYQGNVGVKAEKFAQMDLRNQNVLFGEKNKTETKLKYVLAVLSNNIKMARERRVRQLSPS